MEPLSAALLMISALAQAGGAGYGAYAAGKQGEEMNAQSLALQNRQMGTQDRQFRQNMKLQKDSLRQNKMVNAANMLSGLQGLRNSRTSTTGDFLQSIVNRSA